DNASLGVGGGGILNQGSHVTLLNCTFSGNSAVPANFQGGAIANVFGGTAELINTIVANSPSGGDLSGDASSYSGHNDLIDARSAGSDGTNGYFGPSSLYNVAAGLDPSGLQDNGGPTQTVALLATSPAIEAGDAGAAPTTDQRGQPRLGRTDLG